MKIKHPHLLMSAALGLGASLAYGLGTHLHQQDLASAAQQHPVAQTGSQTGPRLPAPRPRLRLGVVPTLPAVNLQGAADQADLHTLDVTLWHQVVTRVIPNTVLKPLLVRSTDAAASCAQVLVTAAVPAAPGLPVSLVFNRKSLYLEGYLRGPTYWYMTDTPTCKALFPQGQVSRTLSFNSQHKDLNYSMDVNAIRTALGTLSKTDPDHGDQKPLNVTVDQLSFLTSEAWRFSGVMAHVTNGTGTGKGANPEVNRWDAASAAVAAPVPPDPVLSTAIATLTTLKDQTP